MEGGKSFFQVGQRQGIVGDPSIDDGAVGVDYEYRALGQPGVAFPDVVLDPVSMGDLTLPVREHGKVDPELLRERDLGKGGGDGDRDMLGAQLPDAGSHLSQLGQLVASDVAEVEDVENKEHGSGRQQFARGDRLFECAPEFECWSAIADARAGAGSLCQVAEAAVDHEAKVPLGGARRPLV